MSDDPSRRGWEAAARGAAPGAVSPLLSLPPRRPAPSTPASAALGPGRAQGRPHRRTESCSHSRARARPTPPATTWDPRRPLTSRGARCHLLGLWFRLLRPLPGPSSRHRARAPRVPRAHHDASGSRHFRQGPGRVGPEGGARGVRWCGRLSPRALIGQTQRSRDAQARRGRGGAAGRADAERRRRRRGASRKMAAAMLGLWAVSAQRAATAARPGLQTRRRR